MSSNLTAPASAVPIIQELLFLLAPYKMLNTNEAHIRTKIVEKDIVARFNKEITIYFVGFLGGRRAGSSPETGFFLLLGGGFYGS